MWRIFHRKLTTRFVWWWERNRTYPIRDRWPLLPPIAVIGQPCILALLTTPKGIGDAAWSAWSWLRQMSNVLSLRLYVDGTLEEEQRRAFLRVFPKSRIFEREEILNWNDPRACRLMPFLRNHPMGRKLAVALKTQQECSFVYSDSDVIVFSRPEEIFAFAQGEGGNRYIQEESESCFDSWLLRRADELRLDAAQKLNGGLFLIRRDSLDLDLACNLLSGWTDDRLSWFTEQTLMAILMRKGGATPLPRDRYVVSNRRQFYFEDDVNYDHIALRHFTGPTRHVLYHQALPRILAASQSLST